MMMLGNVDRREIKMQEMDTYIVVIPSPAFRIIFHLLHFDKKDIGENADIAIESMNLCSFRITIRLRYPAQISGPDIRPRYPAQISGSDIRLRYSGNHRIHYTVIPRVNGLKPFTHFMNAHALAPICLR